MGITPDDQPLHGEMMQRQAEVTHAAITHAAIIQAMSGSALEVFSTMLGLEASPGTPAVGRQEPAHSSDIVALLGLTGDWSGSGRIFLRPPFACQLASAMMMQEYTDVCDDVLDAIAEIANMVIGNAKNTLEPTLGPLRLSTPMILYGGEFETRTAGSPEWVTLPILCETGLLTVQITLSPNKSPKNKESLRREWPHCVPITPATLRDQSVQA
jgi:chemotaxis protein CheX